METFLVMYATGTLLIDAADETAAYRLLLDALPADLRPDRDDVAIVRPTSRALTLSLT